jgi:hypothetical protein
MQGVLSWQESLRTQTGRPHTHEHFHNYVEGESYEKTYPDFTSLIDQDSSPRSVEQPCHVRAAAGSSS